MTNKEIKLKFGEDIKRKRAEKNISQRTAACQLGISLTAFQNWEQSLSLPKPEMLEMVCNYFCLNVEDYKING